MKHFMLDLCCFPARKKAELIDSLIHISRAMNAPDDAEHQKTILYTIALIDDCILVRKLLVFQVIGCVIGIILGNLITELL